MINIKPKYSNFSEIYFDRLCNLKNAESLTLPTSKEEVIEYLKLWNRTYMHNGNTINIIPYEELIYYEIEYKNDEKIQNLIQILKEKIAYFYELKMLLLDNLIDKNIYNNIKQHNIKTDTGTSSYGKRAGIDKVGGKFYG